MAESAPPVPIDYTSRDYVSLRSDLIRAIPEWIPEWTNRTESDFGIVLIEMFSYVGDVLGYYIDRIANEAFISTAVQRASVLSLAQMIDYRPSGLSAATVNLTISISDDASGAITIPAGTQFSTVPEAGIDPVVFETDEEITLGVGASGQVSASQGVSVEEPEDTPVGVSSGRPDQVFSLYYPAIIEGTLTLYVDEDGAGPETRTAWRYVNHLIDASSDDRVYTTILDENDITYVRFGDDVNGRAPTQGSVITAEYRVGVGDDGNVGAGTITEVVQPIVGLDSVVNPQAATGGTDAESVSSIRKQAPRSLTALERAVTIEDYATLAEKVSGVQHAKAVAETYTSVLLYIAPSGGGAATSALKQSVQTYLSSRKMINTSITIGDPTYVPIDITVDPLRVADGEKQQAVQTAAENALAEMLEIDNVDFGYDITLSQVYKVLGEVAGVELGSVVDVLNRTGTTDLDTVISIGDNEIPTVGTITVNATGGIL